MRSVKAFLIVLFGLGWLAPAQAVDVPVSEIVNAGGFEWAWAAPCPPAAPSCGNVPLVMHDGWSIASAANFAASFTGFADLLADFGNGAKCASAYFNSGFSHCDAVDVSGANGVGSLVYNAPAAWGGNNPLYMHFAEAFVVRGGAQVPEPATVTLVALALLGAGLTGRRQRRH